MSPRWRPGRAAAKTARRTRAYLGAALLARPPMRDQVFVAWGLVAVPPWAGLAGPGPSAPEVPLPLLVALVAVLAAIAAVDARWGLIPDPLNGLVLALGLVRLMLSGGIGTLWPALLGCFAAYAAGRALGRLHLALRGLDGFGGGDVKLVAAAVPWLGLDALPWMLVVAVASAFAGLALIRCERAVGRRDAIAFGPHLALGLAWTLVLGSPFA